MATVQIILGLICLGLGGDALVRGAVGAANRLKISPLVTGLVLVGFGTSIPELVTSLKAALSGSPGIAVGNVVGSNIANVLLILGLTALIFPITTQPKALKRDGPVLAIATAACVGFGLAGAFGRVSGALFVAALIAYLVFTYKTDSKRGDAQAQLHEQESELIAPASRSLALSLLVAFAGIAIVILGANWMIEGSTAIARQFGVSETIIGLTIVAVGTSLPELAASIVAAFRKQTDIALGNIIGSNIFNVFGILGMTSLAIPIEVPVNALVYDVWILAAVTALLLWAAHTDSRLSRREGGFFLILYAAYIAFLIFRGFGMM